MGTPHLEELHGKILTHEERLARGDAIIHQLQADLAANTAATKRIEASTADLVTFFESVKGAFRVLNWVGKLAGPLGKVAFAATAIGALWHGVKAGVVAWLKW